MINLMAMHNQRFFSYLSLFTFFMIVLVTGENYLVLFLGWEGIGVVSYLLINFWYTRIAANKSGILALTQNRVGDALFSLGLFSIFWVFGNLDYSTIFSLVPYMNEISLTIISFLILGGAIAKSAQLGTTWLPWSMEGLINTYLNNKCSEAINVSNVKDNYLLSTIPRETLEIIIGNLLGDGCLIRKSIALDRINQSKAQAYFAMTMSAKSYNYMLHLYSKVYAQFNPSKIYAYPNIDLPQHKDKVVTQYLFSTQRTELFTNIHSLWYRWDPDLNKYIKIVPISMNKWFSAVSLAYWIMVDGYFDSHGRTQTILLCTESFTQDECIFLQTLLKKLGIKSTLKIRNKMKNTYRIRISKTSMPLLRELVSPHMHKDYMYKLYGK